MNNDAFACRTIITGGSLAVNGTNVSATHEAGEPVHIVSTNSLVGSVWYSWTAPSSGAVVLEVTDPNFSVSTWVVAVYAGTNLPTLTKLAANSTANNRSRAVFSALGGTNYQIAVDAFANPTSGDTGRGTFVLSLTNSPPPTNDLFANAKTIPTEIFETSGSFFGANREIGEPSHGNTNYLQTLWYNWAPPNDLVGVASVPMRLTASGVSFPPGLGVYTGNAVGSLTTVPIVYETNGMTSTATFNAAVGSVYRIALAGSENDEASTLPQTGNFQFRLSSRPLALTILHLSKTTNGDRSISFSADAQIDNRGSAGSNPVRVYVTAIPGASMRGSFVSTYSTNEILQGTPSTPVLLGPKQTNTVPISGIAPAPSTINQGDSVAVGYAVYARLQEQTAGDWTTVDQVIVLFGQWPSFDGIVGPSGGVIRLDPNLTGAGSTTLTNVSILGTNTVSSGTTNLYTSRAKYANGTQFDFTNTTWTSSVFTVTGGIFRTGMVLSNTPATIGMYYSNLAQLRIVQTNVTVLAPAKLALAKMIGNTNFTMQIQGTPNKKQAIDAATALKSNTAWVPLVTNVLDVNGRWNFTNAVGTNKQRYFRAREVP